jgi:HK97 family phage major capsid protein
MLASYVKEIEERQAFIDGLVAEPKGENGDLSDEQLELVTRSRDRVQKITTMMGPLEEMARVNADNVDRWREIAQRTANVRETPQQVEYRSAGEYMCDMWQAHVGSEDARGRLTRWGQEHRAAAHQTTADNPGLLPTPILGPVINYIDAARPCVNALGAQQLPAFSFSRPKVTQHTAVAAQTSEKAELTSQKMTVTKMTVSPSTYGGYVNLSRQDVDWSQPSVMDLVVNDLAAQYAILTEQTAVQAFYAGGTAGSVTVPATPTSDNVAAALWSAAASVYTATKGQGRLLAVASPDVLGIIGPLFAPINPIDAQSEGFNAATFGQGIMGAVAGIPIVVTSGFAAAKSLMVLSSAAAEVYEDRIGSLQVIEPSVLGIQVAYAGLFATLITQASGIIKVTVT